MKAIKDGNRCGLAGSMLVFSTVLAVSMLIGCASSEEASDWERVSPPAAAMTEGMQQTIDSLRAENTQLRGQSNRAESDKRTLTARIAELEMKMSESREKPAPRTIGNPSMEYDRGLALFRQRQYQEAASLFMGLLNTGVAGDLEANARYWVGECLYGMKEYREALTHFEKIATYRASTKKDDAQIMIANSFFMMGDKSRAKKEYQKLLDQFPASPYAKRAKEKLAKM